MGQKDSRQTAQDLALSILFENLMRGQPLDSIYDGLETSGALLHELFKPCEEGDLASIVSDRLNHYAEGGDPLRVEMRDKITTVIKAATTFVAAYKVWSTWSEEFVKRPEVQAKIRSSVTNEA